MTKVILQPTGPAQATIHYADTIERPVPLSQLEEHLGPREMAEIREIYGERPVPTWGVTPGKNNVNRTQWRRIEPGDRVLFARLGGIFATGEVTEKTHNPSLARALWKENAHGETWEYVYFVDEVREQFVAYEQFNQIVDYKPNARIQRFTVLDREKSNLAIAALMGLDAPDDEVDSEVVRGGEAAFEANRSGQGFSGSPDARKAVEDLAMQCAETYFRLRGYEVHDRSKNRSFDLECTRPGERLLVEVKGTTTSGDQVLLTKKEVELAQDPEMKTVLFIQHHVQLEKDGSKLKASGGHSRIVEPWQPEDGQLTPITYRCQV